MRPRSLLKLAGLCMVLSLATGVSGGCQGGAPITNDDRLDLSVSRSTLFYWGHSTFSITSADGHVLLIDPYNPELTGYRRYQTAADVVLISHEAPDHNDTSWVTGNPAIVRGLNSAGQVVDIDQTYGPFHIQSVPAMCGEFPDRDSFTAMFVIEVDGVRLAHLGDLWQLELDDFQTNAIGRPDFLMIPVGGGPTIDGQMACHIVDQLGPGYVLPMHYWTLTTAFPLSSRIGSMDSFVDCFLSNPVTSDRNGITLNYASTVTSPTLLLLTFLP